MQEILFRGFHKQEDGPDTAVIDGVPVRGRWVYGYYCKLGGNVNKSIGYILPRASSILFDDDDIKIGGFCEVIPSTVGQYTGLTDKTQKKIFVGDIVKNARWGNTYQVNFSEERGGFYPFAKGDGCGCCERDVVGSDKVIVIGTIYDAPPEGE